MAVVDGQGRVAAHTGAGCIPFAGHLGSEQVSCQANMMASERVWPAMLDAFAAAQGPLSERLLTALDAGEKAGGDVRGRQSAALLVVPAEGEAWQTVVELRVEDHPEPLAELRRLLRLQGAYRMAGEADELLGQGRHDEASSLYSGATELAPERIELRFWAGLAAALAGDLEAGLSQVKEAVSAHSGWRELLGRLPPQLAPSARSVLARLDGESTDARDSG